MCVLFVAPVLANDPTTLSTTSPHATAEAAAVDTSALLIPPDPCYLKDSFGQARFDVPVQLLYPPDDPDGILIVCRNGKVYRLSKSAEAALPGTFLDLSDRVSRSVSRQGMLGMAFHPQYSRNRKLFVSYTVDPEYGQAARVFDVLTVVMLLIGIAFGIGCRRFGKLSAFHEVLAIFFYAIFIAFSLTPSDVGGLQKILWAIGIFAAIASSSYCVLWLGYGKFASTAFGGIANKIMAALSGEGLEQPQSTLIDPVAQYGHSDGLALVGGRVYRGRNLPDLVGQYVFGDFASGVVWSVDLSGERPRTRRIAIGNIKITSIGEDFDGELYVLGANGRILQLTATPPRSKPFPATLSATGLFESTSDLRPVKGAVQYDVNVSFWSDGTSKNRFFALPERNSVGYSADGNWKFPIGTVFVKTFVADGSVPEHANTHSEMRLEPRLLVSGPAGWHGYAYQWDEGQQDACLIDRPDPTEPQTNTIQHFPDRHFLNRGQCNWCHTPENGNQLGLLSAQLNRPFPQDGKSINQITAMAEMGIFFDDPTDSDFGTAWPGLTDQGVDLEYRARTYLNVNCAPCHSPVGLFSLIDLRHTTPLEQTELLTRNTLSNSTGKPGFRNAILPGHPEKSELIRRMLAVDADQMPPTANSVPDAEAIEILSEWIRGMSKSH